MVARETLETLEALQAQFPLGPDSLDPLTIIDRYYPEGTERRAILIAHGVDVATLALELAEAHPELAIDRRFVYEAAMLHDIGIYLTDAEGIDCHGSEPYIRHGYLGAELLRSLGLPRHAHVAERHTGAGLTMQELRDKGVDLPEGVYMPETVEERLICYADKFYSKTRLGRRKELDKVRLSLLRHGPASLERFDALASEFGGGQS